MKPTTYLTIVLIASLALNCQKEDDPGVDSPCDYANTNYEWIDGECVCPPPFQEIFGDCKELQSGISFIEYAIAPLECICNADEKGILKLNIGATVTLPGNPDPPHHVPVSLDLQHPDIMLIGSHMGTLYYETEIGTLSPGDSISTRFGINNTFSCNPWSWPDNEETRNGFFLCQVTHPDTIQATYYFERRISETDFAPDTCRFVFFR